MRGVEYRLSKQEKREGEGNASQQLTAGMRAFGQRPRNAPTKSRNMSRNLRPPQSTADPLPAPAPPPPCSSSDSVYAGLLGPTPLALSSSPRKISSPASAYTRSSSTARI